MSNLFTPTVKLVVVTESRIISFEEFDIDFDVELTAFGLPNKAEISIWNLDDATRLEIVAKTHRIEFYAGFVHPRLIFIGRPIEIEGEENEMNVRLSFRCEEGVELIHRHFNKTYAKGTPYKTILDDLCRATAIPYTLDDFFLTDRIVMAETFSGSVSTILQKLCHDLDHEWSVSHGLLEIRLRDYPFLRDPIAIEYVLDQDSGLISTQIGTRTREFTEKEQYNQDKEERQIAQNESDEEKRILREEKKQGLSEQEKHAAKKRREEARAKAKAARQAARDHAVQVMTINATALIVPEVMPGRLLSIVTPDQANQDADPIYSVCLINSVRYYGDNYGGDFLMDIVADLPYLDVLALKKDMSFQELTDIARLLNEKARTIRSLR